MSAPAKPPPQIKLGTSRFFDPHVDDRLITEEGEQILDEIRRHWVTRLWPGSQVVLGMIAFGVMPQLGHLWWLGLVLGVGLGVRGFWGMHVEFMDRFVVTNLRVFRVNGVIDQNFASMPLSRVLDIAMQRPFWGRFLATPSSCSRVPPKTRACARFTSWARRTPGCTCFSAW